MMEGRGGEKKNLFLFSKEGERVIAEFADEGNGDFREIMKDL